MIQLNGQKWNAMLLPEHGMNTVQLSWDGEQILRDPEGFDGVETSCLHGTPLLLPPNRTEKGRFTFEGKAYQLPVNEEAFQNHLHGFLRFAAFSVTEQTETAVSGIYENRGELFPFPFSIRVTCRITEEGYCQTFVITNTGKTNMPLTFGVHTNFQEKDFFQVPIQKQCLTNENHIPIGEPAELNERQRRYRDGMRPDGEAVDGFYTAAGNTARIGRMEYTVSNNFNHWILFNKGGKQGFISIEPQCGGVNCLNSGRGLGRLAPGATEVFRTVIHPV